MKYSQTANKRRLRAGAGIAALTLAAFASPAFAQDTDVAEPGAQTPADPSEDAPAVQGPTAPTIVVTGSRIRRPELEATTPITTFSGEQVYDQAGHNLGEALNELPALRSTYAQSNPGSGIGVAGLNLLDLRGLGAQRTLVLVNGRRHVPSDLQVTASAVDINTIPTDLVERVDIVTGGNSAVYGSDAIAGVVNFILKDDFEGVTVRGGAGMPRYGAGANYFLSGVAGMNFADGRGNIAVSGEYTRQNRLYASDVPWRRQRDGFVTVDFDPAGGSDGIPDTAFARDLRNSSISYTGIVPFIQNTGNPACGGENLLGDPFNCDFVFTPGGELVPVSFAARTGTSAFSGYIGGNSVTGQEHGLVSVFPSNERYVANLLAHYEFSEAAEFFVEAKYSRARTTGSNSGPAFDQGQGVTFLDPRSQFRLDNPFLNQSAQETIAAQLLASGNNNGLINVFGPLTAGDRADIAAGTYRFAMAKNFLDLGIRDEDALRQTYRVVAGFRGAISDNWSYEISGNYGRTEEEIDILGNVNVQRLMLALDAGVNPATGATECRSQFDPSAAFASPDVPASAGSANLAADIAACVPYNPFGYSPAGNAAARQYITSDAGNEGYLEQVDVTAFVSGDTSGFFELPGGPIGVAVGAEYRREDAFFEADDEINQGLTFLNALATFDPDPFEVKEAFGELNVPILADRPFFEELTLSGAARVSDYKGATGTVWAYNVGGRYSPVQDITFRANYGRAIRAPNYRETADPLSQNFAPGFDDPCGSTNIGNGSANREANCQADLGANLNDPAYQQIANSSYSLEILSGGNAALTEETSDSLTLGVVFQPRWVPGLAITADYYDITVDSVVASPSAQAIVNSCYDLPSLDNQFCALFERFQGPGRGPNSEAPGEILVQSLEQTPLNFAKRQRRGIDFDVSYRTELAEKTFLNTRLFYTHVLKTSNFQDPTNPDFEDRILSEMGDPVDEFVFDVDLTFDELTIGYGAHYIGPMLTASYETFFPLNGDDPQNADAFPFEEYPEVLYHDIRVAWQVGGVDGDRPFEFYAGIDNVLDKKPPFGLGGLGTSAIYDVWGRRYYAGFRANF